MTMQFTMVQEDANEVKFIDLSQCASLLNRRFYRQGLNWAVSGFKLLSAATGAIGIVKLPNTWVMSNAWEKGFRAWSKMNKDAMEETSVRPKFLDFKIFANHNHASLGIDRNLLPQCHGIPAVTAEPGEWESSKLRIPVGPASPGDTSEREIIAVGASYQGPGASGVNSVSLIEGYASSRGLPDITDPNVPDDAADAVGTTPENWIQALQNEGTEQDEAVLDDLITENNQAPYPFENGEIPGAPGTFWPDTMYPNGANQLPDLQIHDTEFVTTSTIGGTTRLRGGNFPCGLVGVVSSFTPGEEMILQVSLVPGNHRGYLCEPMTEM